MKYRYEIRINGKLKYTYFNLAKFTKSLDNLKDDKKVSSKRILLT